MAVNGRKYSQKLQIVDGLETVVKIDEVGNKITQIQFIWMDLFEIIDSNAPLMEEGKINGYRQVKLQKKST